MTVDIRRRQPDDLDALAQVLVRVHAHDGYPVEGVADPIAWLTPPHELAAWTAWLHDQPIGQISLVQAQKTDDAARLWHAHTGRDIIQLTIPVRLFVDPDSRRHGAGALLMTAVNEYAASNRLAVAFDVMLKDHNAIRLYEAAGCTRIGTIDHTYGDGQHEPAAVYLAPQR